MFERLPSSEAGQEALPQRSMLRFFPFIFFECSRFQIDVDHFLQPMDRQASAHRTDSQTKFAIINVQAPALTTTQISVGRESIRMY